MTATSARTYEQAHRLAVVNPMTVIVTELHQLLTTRLTAYIAIVTSGKTVARWASGEVAGVRAGSEQRLRTAYEIAQLFAACGESAETSRAWFLGLNPQLDDISPAEALHNGLLKDTLAAARAFVSGSY